MKREQAIFDAVAVHLLTQNMSSMAKGGCAYRGGRGTMCAIGVLIPDEKYSKSLERRDVTDIIHCNEGLKVFGFEPTKPELNLMAHLQFIHDNSAPQEWPEALRALAGTRLNSSVVDDFEVQDE